MINYCLIGYLSVCAHRQTDIHVFVHVSWVSGWKTRLEKHLEAMETNKNSNFVF
jgi:hypothetical protein